MDMTSSVQPQLIRIRCGFLWSEGLRQWCERLAPLERTLLREEKTTLQHKARAGLSKRKGLFTNPRSPRGEDNGELFLPRLECPPEGCRGLGMPLMAGQLSDALRGMDTDGAEAFLFTRGAGQGRPKTRSRSSRSHAAQGPQAWRWFAGTRFWFLSSKNTSTFWLMAFNCQAAFWEKCTRHETLANSQLLWNGAPWLSQ